MIEALDPSMLDKADRALLTGHGWLPARTAGSTQPDSRGVIGPLDGRVVLTCRAVAESTLGARWTGHCHRGVQHSCFTALIDRRTAALTGCRTCDR